MVLMPSNETASQSTVAPTPANEFVDIDNVWREHNDTDHNVPILIERCRINETTIVHACHLFDVCVSNLTMLIKEVEAKLILKKNAADAEHRRFAYNPLQLQHSWYEFVSVQVAFYGGLLLGTIFGAVMLFTLKLISDCVTTPNMENGAHQLTRKRSKQLANLTNIFRTIFLILKKIVF